MAMTWRGVMAPLGQKDGIGRMIPIRNVDTDSRKMPIPFRYRPADFGGHHGAIPIGTVDRVWIEAGKLWGEGRFDDEDDTARTVFSKIKRRFLRHISVDLEPKTNKLMAATILDVPAFEESEVLDIADDTDEEPAEENKTRRLESVAFAVATVDDEEHLEWNLDSESTEEEGYDITVFAAETEIAYQTYLLSTRFAVSGSPGLPIADRGRAWDSGAATKRVAAWANGDASKLARAYMWKDADKDPTTAAAYKLPFADVIDGKLTIVPKAIFAIASVLQGGRGGVNIPDEDTKKIRSKIAGLYSKMSKKFGEKLDVPWANENSTHAAADIDAYAVEIEHAYQQFLLEWEKEGQRFNWVEDVGGLPSYIKRIAKHLKRKGFSESHAIATAVNAAKKMCATADVSFPGVQHVNPGSRAEACAAVASWEAKKAKARAT